MEVPKEAGGLGADCGAETRLCQARKEFPTFSPIRRAPHFPSLFPCCWR